MKKFVHASNNPGKIAELSELLSHLGFELISQSELGVNEIAENGLSFIENAIIKARHGALCTGLPAIADDSGLVVDALGGAPGIYSARFAGVKSSTPENNAKLSQLISNLPPEQCQARYVCVIASVFSAEDPLPIIAEATWEGQVIATPRGTQGFGYDPYFYLPELQKTVAEISKDQKNKMSHRGKALAKWMQALEARLRANNP